ncbi:MAG: hypothetical protein JXA73_04530 [Acidobacteria bacterium]|nr:hypothetical protein [Acidobacteriota bacterium]
MADNGIGGSMLMITTLFLAAVFIAAEFYRCSRRITGSIREIRPLDGDPTGLMGARLRVATSEAGEITALVSGCQMCVSRLEIGDEVTLIPGPNGYIMRSSWLSRPRHGACPRRVAS